jgi:hypothetical protein
LAVFSANLRGWELGAKSFENYVCRWIFPYLQCPYLVLEAKKLGLKGGGVALVNYPFTK